MFYESERESALRFGDVLAGFLTAVPVVDDPMLPDREGPEAHAYSIDVNKPPFCVVLSPCCSIGRKRISLAPLIHVRSAFFKNEYLAEDLTRVNRRMEPHQTLPSHTWDRMSDDERARRLNQGPGYAFLDTFVYEQHPLFPEYHVHRQGQDLNTRYYMIQFGDAFRVNCDSVNPPEHAPLHAKQLQLSIQARSELRDKLAHYYARVPEEDQLD